MIAKVNKDNRITLPKEIRQILNVEPGDEIVFVSKGGVKHAILIGRKVHHG